MSHTHSVDLLLHILPYLPKNPVVYMRLAMVCRSWYAFFTSDRLWYLINPAGMKSDLALHFCRATSAISGRELAAQWSMAQRPQVDNPYMWLGALSNYSPQTLSGKEPFHTRNRQLIWCGLHLNPHCLECGSPQIRASFALVRIAITSAGCAMAYAAPDLTDNSSLLLEAIESGCPRTCAVHGGRDLPARYASPRLLNDPEFAKQVLPISPRSLKYFSHTIRRTRDLVMLAVEADPKAIKYSPLRSEGPVAFAALVMCGDTIRYMPQFQKSRLMVALAVDYCGELVRFASPQLQNDLDIAKRAIMSSAFAIKFISRELQCRRDIVSLAISRNGLVLEALPEWAADRQIVASAVAQNPQAICFAAPEVCANALFVLRLVAIDVHVLEHVESSLRNKPDIAYAAAKLDFQYTIQHLDNWWKHSIQFVALGIQSTPDAFFMASIEVRDDPFITREFFSRYTSFRTFI